MLKLVRLVPGIVSEYFQLDKLKVACLEIQVCQLHIHALASAKAGSSDSLMRPRQGVR